MDKTSIRIGALLSPLAGVLLGLLISAASPRDGKPPASSSSGEREASWGLSAIWTYADGKAERTGPPACARYYALTAGSLGSDASAWNLVAGNACETEDSITLERDAPRNDPWARTIAPPYTRVTLGVPGAGQNVTIGFRDYVLARP